VSTLGVGLNSPDGIAVDSLGNVYVASSAANSIIKMTSNGVVSSLSNYPACSVFPGCAYAGGYGGLVLESSGNLYLGISDNNLIAKVTSTGVMTTFAGSGAQGFKDGGGTSASFYYPSGIAIDSAGNLYVADWGNNLIRKITR
jgi:DNA-binding beta-propeller fold protein YncE